MNVLFLTYSFLPNLGGVERSVQNLATLLIAGGDRVTVATHDYWALPFRWRPSGTPPTLHFHVPSQTDPRPAVRIFRTAINPLNTALLAAFCVTRRIAVLHCHHLNTDTVYARRLARLLGVPFVLTLRGGETEEWIHNDARRRYVIEQLRGADHVTAVSTSLLAGAAALVPEIGARASVVPNPVDPEQVRAAVGPAEPRRPPYAFFAGRLEPMKDVECLLDAWAGAAAADPALPDLVVAGEGSLGAELRRRVAASPAAARIELRGRISYPRTLRMIADATMVVLPSRSSEGCPNVVLEAMALGTPVVVSDLGSLGEIVDGGTCGRLFPIGDPAALRARVVELSRDPELRHRLAAAARRRLAERHAPPAIAARYHAIYDEAARERHGDAARARRAEAGRARHPRA